MNKRIAICAVLFAFAVFAAAAKPEYYQGLGVAEAGYLGTTKDTTIEKAYNNSMRNFDKLGVFLSTPIPFNGKLTRRQNDLLWKALGQYDYAAGEIYSVTFAELGALKHFFNLIVQINADGSCTWKGFTFDDQQLY